MIFARLAWKELQRGFLYDFHEIFHKFASWEMYMPMFSSCNASTWKEVIPLTQKAIVCPGQVNSHVYEHYKWYSTMSCVSMTRHPYSRPKRTSMIVPKFDFWAPTPTPHPHPPIPTPSSTPTPIPTRLLHPPPQPPTHTLSRNLDVENHLFLTMIQ